MNPAPQILSHLTSSMLRSESSRVDFPKWNTLCTLKLVGLPVLDTMFVAPKTDRGVIVAVADSFVNALHTDQLLIRSDGGLEDGNYFRGGNSLDIPAAIDLAVKLSNGGRAVLLMEPTNRFTNEMSINLMMLKQQGLIIEIVGPGYDAADLNRGGILPQIIIDVKNANWNHYQRLWRSDFTVSLHFEQEHMRRRWRLRYLGESAIPAIGVSPSGNTVRFAKNWLQEKGYVGLWCHWEPHIRLSLLRQWYDEAFAVCQVVARRRTWDVMVMSGTQLDSGRFVWWDVQDGLYKFKVPTHSTSSKGSISLSQNKRSHSSI